MSRGGLPAAVHAVAAGELAGYAAESLPVSGIRSRLPPETRKSRPGGFPQQDGFSVLSTMSARHKPHGFQALFLSLRI
jgi:hypothetical protein